ncbi:MAG: UDP-galactopyranose mutase [Verrucomicrobiota bacterium]
MKASCDCLIVGAGLSGLVIAQSLAERAGLSSIIVEKRDHIGGNCFDYHDEAGVLVHKYGPHYFRASGQHIVDYLSNFTQWLPTDYEIRSFTKGKFWNFPINLNTFEAYLGRRSSTEEFEKWLEDKRVPIDEPANSEEIIISQIGWEFYEMFFRGYTTKHWKMDPKELDKSVCGRIPIRTNRDDSYLREPFQALPLHGYSAMFRNMHSSMENHVRIELETDWRSIKDKVDYRWLVYTGPIDEYFESCYDPLPYRSLSFEPESFSPKQLKEREVFSGKKGFWQPVMQVNYPEEDVPYTRIVEIKHATRQDIPQTTIVREYPQDHSPGREPYYPVPSAESRDLLKKYQRLAAHEKRVSFVGRLAAYRYINMDQVVGMALKESDRILRCLTPKVNYNEGRL